MFSADNGKVALATSGFEVHLWNRNDLFQMQVTSFLRRRSSDVFKTLSGHSAGVAGLAFSPDGKYLASASADGTIKLWHVERAQDILTLRGHTGAVQCVAWSFDGQKLVSGGADGTVRIWDGTPLVVPPPAHPTIVTK